MFQLKRDKKKVYKCGGKEMLSYEEFKLRIEKQLKEQPEGLTWSEIKENENLPQKYPNNKWVRQLEQDINLRREKIKGKMIWKLSEN